jgi:hypothetical protein
VHTLRTSTAGSARPHATAAADDDDDGDEENPDCLAELRHVSETAAGAIPWACAARAALRPSAQPEPSHLGAAGARPAAASAVEQLLSVAQAALTALLARGLGGASAAAGWRHSGVLPSLLAALQVASTDAAAAMRRAHDVDYVALRVQDDRAAREGRFGPQGVAGPRHAAGGPARRGGASHGGAGGLGGGDMAAAGAAAGAGALGQPPRRALLPLRPAARRTRLGDLEAARGVDALLGFLLGAARSRHLAPALLEGGLVAQLCRDPTLLALNVRQSRHHLFLSCACTCPKYMHSLTMTVCPVL